MSDIPGCRLESGWREHRKEMARCDESIASLERSPVDRAGVVRHGSWLGALVIPDVVPRGATVPADRLLGAASRPGSP